MFYLPSIRQLTRAQAEGQLLQLYKSIPNVEYYCSLNEMMESILTLLIKYGAYTEKYGVYEENWFLRRIIFTSSEHDKSNKIKNNNELELSLSLSYIQIYIPNLYRWACAFANESIIVTRKLYNNNPVLSIRRSFMKKATNMTRLEKIKSFMTIS